MKTFHKVHSIHNPPDFLGEVINAIDDPVVVKDSKYRWVLLNDRACEMIGGSREELIGKNDYDMFPKEQADVFRREDKKVLRTGKTNINTEEITWNGGIRTVSAKKSLFRDSVTGHKFIAITIRDITEQITAEQELRDSEEKYRLLANNMKDNIWVLDIASLKLDYISPSVRELRGFSISEAMQQSLAEILTPPSLKVALTALKEELAQDKKRKRKKPVTRTLELEHMRKDASTFWAEVRATLVHDDSGKPTKVIGSTRDISERRRNQKILQESETKYRELFENSVDAIFIADTKTGMILDANKKAEHLIGRPRKELIGMHQSKLHPPEHKTLIKKQFAKSVRSGRASNLDTEIMCKDGKRLWVEISARVMKLDGKKVIQGIFKDVTKSRKVEAALCEREETFRALAENNLDCIMRFDRQCRHLYVNPVVKEQTGIPPEKFIGKNHTELGFPKHLNKLWEEAIQKVFRTKKNHRIEFELPDGIWIDWSLMPEFDEKRKVTAVLTSARDITERKQAEESLRQSESSLAEAQRIAHLGNWDWDIEHNQLRWSDEVYRIFGLSPQEFGATYEAFLGSVHYLDRKMVDDAIRAALHRRKKYNIEHRIIRPNGKERFVYEEAEVTFDRFGRPLRMLGIIQDITEHKKAEDELRKHKENLEELVQKRTAGLEASNQKLQEAEAELQRLVQIDGLTGVSNHRHMQKRLEADFKKARAGEESLACVMVDVDNFKQINDQHGHQIGDRILKVVAEILRGETRMVDLVARYGGDEFILLLPKKPNHRAGLEQILERLKNIISKRVIHFGKHRIKITASIGAALLPDPRITSTRHFVHSADKAMYAAKEAGKNCWRIF